PASRSRLFPYTTLFRSPYPALPRDFYNRDVATVARELLGKLLVRRVGGGFTVGRIVEAEAYLATDDPANHSFRGRTQRNASMFRSEEHTSELQSLAYLV